MTATSDPGSMDFGGLRITFDERVLRPRPWTRAQAEWASDLMSGAPLGRVLELCAGAGHIGLASIVGNDRHLVCVDLDLAAVEHCWSNARAAGLSERVEVRHGRLEDVVGPDETFPVIIADPPWVPAADTGRFPEDPLVAIDGGEDGLDVAKACLEIIEGHLATGGSAVVQVGTAAQVDALERWAEGRARIRAVERRLFGGQGALVRFVRADQA